MPTPEVTTAQPNYYDVLPNYLKGTVYSLSSTALVGPLLGNFCDAIYWDTNQNLRFPGGFTREGNLFIPGRGVLAIRSGDVVCVDNTGWPVLVSAYSANNGGWTLTLSS